ncbi:MAG: prolipoprotein diacylglyceryl transferase [Candidatus Cloacimonetes bacterium]|nr:prolipoprotein diacylglyceryl transferase [Candidatus Cloacimonadota bacterium]
MIKFPNIPPHILKIGSFEIRWYGILYAVSFIIGYLFMRRSFHLRNVNLTKEQFEDFIFKIMLGVIIGGRLGSVIFYNFEYYMYRPWEVFAFWHGGMSFHGGALGVILFGYLFTRKNKISFYDAADVTMPYVAIGLGLGRLGNFINGELYGRVTNVPWAMIFPQSDGLPRHPSQLYELFFEGILLSLLSFLLLKKSNRSGIVFWFFIGFYGVVRFLLEFVREPDENLGFIFSFMTMGQILSSFMVIASLIGMFFVFRKGEINVTKK